MLQEREGIDGTGGVLAGSRLVIRWSPDLELSYFVGDCAPIP
jgi:hypothetical protein